MGDSRYIYPNELDKTCFHHEMGYGDFQDLPRRTASDKVLRDKAFHIAKNRKYDGYQRDLASMFYKFFDKKTASGSGVKREIKSNQELADKLHKPFIRKFKKQKVQSSFINNIWSANMHLISKFNKGVQFLLCVIDVYSKYICFVPLKDKKGITITNAFQKILKEYCHKPNKIWVD